MRLVNVESLKMKLGMDGKEVIGYSELLEACKSMGMARSIEEAIAFARVLNEADVVIARSRGFSKKIDSDVSDSRLKSHMEIPTRPIIKRPREEAPEDYQEKSVEMKHYYDEDSDNAHSYERSDSLTRRRLKKAVGDLEE
ncbi:hypothetical protein QYF36_005762 [Acer negundo]|nr:hypothetical protein QYF36_005762 [Acer negundo]